MKRIRNLGEDDSFWPDEWTDLPDPVNRLVLEKVLAAGEHHYEIREKPVRTRLPDGVYAHLDDQGLPTAAVWRKRAGRWEYAAGGLWRSNGHVLDGDDSLFPEGYWTRLVAQ
jgi:hypothetical protein